MTYEEAITAMDAGKLVTLPGWGVIAFGIVEADRKPLPSPFDPDVDFAIRIFKNGELTESSYTPFPTDKDGDAWTLASTPSAPAVPGTKD
ncbi:MAG: hypothetical protein ACRYGI_11670 [Janthinobacterium lividum]